MIQQEDPRQFHQLDAVTLKGLLDTGQVSPTELAEHFLARIAEHPELGAFVSVEANAALARCEELERGDGEAPRGALWGMPHADKDLAHRAGSRTLYGSAAVRQFLEEHPDGAARQPSDPIITLADEIGLVSLGKTNTPEFGLYGYTESAVAAPAVHPLDHTLGAGGSSGGAAAAVAAELLPWAIGSDGGGSVRIPAATVGIVGLKPTLGAVPTDDVGAEGGGVVNGPLARSAADAALLFEAMSRSAAGSITSHLDAPLGPLRVGYAIDSPWNPTYSLRPDPWSMQALDVGLGKLSALGHRVTKHVSLEDGEYAGMFLTSWQLAAARIPQWLDVTLMNPVTQWLVEAGRAKTDEEAATNQQDRDAFARRCARRLEDVDVLVTPALGLPPQPVGWHGSAPEENFRDQCAYSPYTSFVNVLGWPAVSVPITQISYGPEGRKFPFSIQIVGKPGTDAALLALAHQLERHGEPTP